MRVGKPGERDCLNCAHCYAEPGDDPVCGRPGLGPFGKYISPARFREREKNRCGPDLPLFEEHPA